MRVCFLSSELAPFAKAGGLGDVSAALPRYLHGAGHDVRLFVPLYSRVEGERGEFVPVDFLQNLTLQMGPHQYEYSIYTARLPDSELWPYFVHCPALYARPTMYTSDPDEHMRYAVLTRVAIETCQRMGWAPEIFHCNDWQSALAPLYLRSVYAWDSLFAATRTLLTIHNIGYQGQFGAQIVGDLDLGHHSALLHQDDLRAGSVNFLKTGVIFADTLNTVSPTYAREVRTPEFGAGLHDLLLARGEKLTGILNGVDYSLWSPELDPWIPHHYSRDDRSGKVLNTQALLAATGLPFAEGTPVMGIVTRLTWQKGLDLLFDCLPQILGERDVRLVVLGSGESRYEDFFSALQHAYPAKVCFYGGYNERLAHLIEAGADLFLMPSRYEPCGLNQMYSLRYGTVPVVRRTGGLADTVQLFDPESGSGNGIVFDHYESSAAAWALNAGLSLYEDKAAWDLCVANGMACDFSWEVQGAEYERLYEGMIGAT